MKARILAVVLAILLFLTVISTSGSLAEATIRSAQDIIEKLTVYYGKYGEKAEEKIAALLEELSSVDPGRGSKWQSIMQLWKTVNDGLTINEGILPDGLPQTDELGLIVLGFQLNPDGSMRNELVERLKVAKASAEKYPNALIICTGGGTAAKTRMPRKPQKWQSG